jgi:hypothetical protein
MDGDSVVGLCIVFKIHIWKWERVCSNAFGLLNQHHSHLIRYIYESWMMCLYTISSDHSFLALTHGTWWTPLSQATVPNYYQILTLQIQYVDWSPAASTLSNGTMEGVVQDKRMILMICGHSLTCYLREKIMQLPSTYPSASASAVLLNSPRCVKFVRCNNPAMAAVLIDRLIRVFDTSVEVPPVTKPNRVLGSRWCCVGAQAYHTTV